MPILLSGLIRYGGFMKLIPENFLLLTLVYTLSETHFISTNHSRLLHQKFTQSSAKVN